MAMEVLLMTDVKDLGAEGDVVTVADGYARNYLLPRKCAAPVTEATRRQLAKKQRMRESEQKTVLEAARAAAARLTNVSVTIPVKIGGDGQMYGSVSVSDIAKALEEQGKALDKNSLEMEKPIKELGVFEVKVRLHPEVEAAIKVWVVEE